VLLEPDEPLDAVLASEAGYGALAVLVERRIRCEVTPV
jgi:hypothetical protein